MYLLAALAAAATLGDVTLPDTATVGEHAVVLNGMGLREKYFLDVYVLGLYLPEKSNDPSHILDVDVPKQLVFTFLLPVDAETLADNMRGRLNATEEAAPYTEQICGWMKDVDKGEQMSMDYAPGVGTTITVGGAVQGTIEDVAVMTALFDLYVGEDPPSASLKTGILGL